MSAPETIPTLYGKPAFWGHSTVEHECCGCHEPIAPLLGRWITLAPLLHFCSADCVRALDEYDPTPWEVDSDDNGPRDEAHRMEQARRLK